MEAAAAMKTVSNFYLKFHTQNHDKKGGDLISTEIQRGGTIVADETELGNKNHEWNEDKWAPAPQSTEWGPAGWFRLDKKNVVVKEDDNLKFLISKEGDDEWNFIIVYGVEYEENPGVVAERYRSGVSYLKGGHLTVVDQFPA